MTRSQRVTIDWDRAGITAVAAVLGPLMIIDGLIVTALAWWTR